ncbi:DUF2164 domain-containing protein [Chitinibacter bivalviorum]|uniref:DUF2164 domain-containing protein n=1 Tax=Chitinibacter bivalviorum TaxID=2739434 RepID=A0A7H9BHK5_9NEIS|nr:DUF2164 domain-containing protein [Chitinibacter bivalviorum]QLG87688.1 DUF2164 domain-containing protein [Chitinibacter bivalviorum]
MTIKLDKDLELRLISSLQRYLDEEMDHQASQLQTQLLLGFIQQEIGPHIYNQAVTDVQQHLHQQTEELNLHCYAIAKSYWAPKGR